MKKPVFILPDNLPRLDVVRETYCSQEQVDRICAHVWELFKKYINDADNNYNLQLLLLSGDLEKQNSSEWRKGCGRLIAHLRGESTLCTDERVPGELSDAIPVSRLGMLDVLYEFDRRVRYLLGYAFLPAHNLALCENADGPYPELEFPITFSQPAEIELAPERVIPLLRAFYAAEPVLCYECAENQRLFPRFGISYEISTQLSQNLTSFILAQKDGCAWLEELLSDSSLRDKINSSQKDGVITKYFIGSLHTYLKEALWQTSKYPVDVADVDRNERPFEVLTHTVESQDNIGEIPRRSVSNWQTSIPAYIIAASLIMLALIGVFSIVLR